MFAKNSSERVRARLLAACLAAVSLLYFGCKPEDDVPQVEGDIEPLIGTWTDAGAGDSYKITDTTLTYTGWDGKLTYEGKIRYVSKATDTAGVIIIEYTTKQKYTTYDETWTPVGDPVEAENNFLGLFWNQLDLTAGTIILGGAANLADSSKGVEAATLDEAKETFKLDKSGDYIYGWNFGPYVLQK
jgi:hypothetical protein